MHRRTLIAVVIALGVLGFGSGWMVVGAFHSDEVRGFQAAWAYHADDPLRMARDVDAVVVARFVDKSPGRIAYSSDGTDAVPFELNQFVVEQGWKQLATGTVVTVERVGGTQHGQPITFDSDGGAYVPGQRYLLFLNRQPGGEVYYLVNDEGRYSIDEHERLTPVARSGKVAAELRDQTLQNVRKRLEGALRERRRHEASLHHELQPAGRIA